MHLILRSVPDLIITFTLSLIARHYFLGNVDFNTIFWTFAWSLPFTVVMSIIRTPANWYFFCWIMLFVVKKNANQIYKDSYGEYGGDYDAP